MQLPAGPALPHTRARLRHWITTAAALVAVLGLSSVIQPSGATARPSGAPPVPGPAPDPERARYPVDCGGRTDVAVEVVDRGARDFDGDGQLETVALVRCASPTGTPPSGIFVLARATEPGAPPRVAETLLPPSEGMSTKDFAVGERGAPEVVATLLGYSSDEVPRCCPDMRREVTWEWRDERFVLVPGPVAGSV